MSIETTQPFLKLLSLQLSYDRGDEISNYITDGLTLTALNREQAINRAVLDIYNEELAKVLAAEDNNMRTTAQKLAEMYQVFNGYETITVNNGIPDTTEIDKSGKVRFVRSIIINSSIPSITNKRALPLTAEQYHDVKYNKYSNYKPTNDRPRFYEFQDTIELMIDTEGSKILFGNLQILELLQPVYQKFDISGDDIVAHAGWENDIIKRAIMHTLTGRQA
jgi:hypothetical protein